MYRDLFLKDLISYSSKFLYKQIINEPKVIKVKNIGWFSQNLLNIESN